jgi:competence protein ComEC
LWAASALSNFWPSAKLVVASFLIIGIFVFRSRTFSILLIAALVGITIVSFRQSALHNQLITSKINSTVLISGFVRSDPQLKPGQVVGSYRKPDQFSALLKVKEIDGIRTDLPIRIRFSTKEKIQIDQSILVKVRLVKSKEHKVAALGIATGDISIITQPRKLFRYTGLIRQEFRNLAADSEAGRLIPGLVLGDTSLQSPAFIEQMRKVGLSHLTAVSGANFALVAAFLFWFLQFVFKSIKQRLWIIIIILFLFIFLVRPTPSVLRAAVMSAVILLSKYFGERSFGITSLAAAITLLILLDPIQSSDPGFALSVLATAGILILSPSLSSKRTCNRWTRKQDSCSRSRRA